MLKKTVIATFVCSGLLASVAGTASAIDYGIPTTGSNSSGSIIVAAGFVVAGVVVARLSSLKGILRRG
jgi:ribose/xylose/arabinose/galactoside ABC-type transport system permease subunit